VSAPGDVFDDLEVIDRIFDGVKHWSVDFWTRPLAFQEFAVHPDHMQNVRLTPRQLHAVHSFLGDDPVMMFDRQSTLPHLCTLAWGKGSGKNMVGTTIQAYLLYVLLCMRNPLDYFGFPEGESVDMVNVAANATQAKRNFFDKFTRRVKAWKWLKANFDIFQAGRPLSTTPNARGVLKITEDSVECDAGVKCVSAHSDSKGYEGYSILFFAMDEASSWETEYVQIEGGDLVAVSKAHAIYDTLRTSALSRSWMWRGLIISYPRQEDDFTLGLAQDIIDGKKEGYADIAATWEVKPDHLWSNPTKFEHKIVRPTGVQLIYPPMDFFTEFRDYPQQSELKYACVPSRTKAYFIYNSLKIHEAASEALVPIAKLKPVEIVGRTPDHAKQTAYRGYEVLDIREVPPEHDYYCHLDLAVSSDTAVMVVAHGEPWEAEVIVPNDEGEVNKLRVTTRVVVDQIVQWAPDNNHLISTLNIDEVLEKLDRKLHFRFIQYDQFQSSYVLEKAARKGKSAGKHNVNNNDYFLLRALINAGAIIYPKHDLLLLELEKLIWNGKRVEHTAHYCFTGDTRIPLLDGTVQTMTELADREAWVYSARPDGSIVPGRARGFRSGWATDFVDVILDNGSTARCTPEHRWMLRDGTYKMAKDLTPGDRLMPCYRRSVHGREYVTDRNDRRTYTHRMVEEGLRGPIPEGVDVHHIKVAAVIPVRLSVAVPVYDLEVEGWSNFALDIGPVVHNSKDVSDCVAGLCQAILSGFGERRQKVKFWF
jgi:hypothetical protein